MFSGFLVQCWIEEGEKHTIFRGKKIILWHKNESLAFDLPNKSIAD